MTEYLRDLWIGTYPSAGAGTPAGLGEGVWRIGLETDTGRLGTPELVAPTPAPSFLAVDRDADVLLDPDGHVVYVTHLAVVDGWTVVADQRGHSLTVLRDGAVVSAADLPAPACVVPA